MTQFQQFILYGSVLSVGMGGTRIGNYGYQGDGVAIATQQKKVLVRIPTTISSHLFPCSIWTKESLSQFALHDRIVRILVQVLRLLDVG